MSAYGYDDDDDEEECPLCLDPLGDDIRFKPCNCGYRICAFCWNHIRTNLNGRCPACRKPYSDDAVEFTPMQPDELKRLQAAKKQRDKEKKDADSLSRKHAANVRVRQRSQVHIQGMTTKIANEDTLPALKGSEQFGRFGKIVKLFFSRRASPPPGATGVGGSASGSGSGPSSSVLTPSSSSTASSSNAHTFYTPVNVYINYSRPDEAAACIYAIDGTVTSDGHKLKAIHGTTRYCPAYLRGVKCTNDNCMQAHEPGEELESSSHPGSGAGPSSQPVLLHQQHQHGQPHRYEGAESGRSNATAIKETREELVNLKHAYKEQSAHTAPALTNAPGLPATASWASKQASNPSAQQASSQSPFQNQPSFSSAFPQIQDSRPTPPPTHSQSSSISSRLPKAQNHPLPPRPPSRATSSVDMSAKSRANGREREREREREQDQYRAREPEKQRQRSAANAEDARQTQQQKGDAPAVPREIPKAQEGILPQDQQSLSVDGPARPELSSSSTSTVIAPPTPPTSEPSASTSSLPALSLPPGLGLPSTSTGTRPLTPVSEFDRTLDTFGDGLSFHFNLPSSPTSTSPKGKERSGETVGGVAFDDGFGTSATQSSRTSRSGSPDFLSDTREMMFSPALPASSASAGAGTDLHPFAADDAEDAKYQGPFDPFAMGSDAFGDADPRAEDPTPDALASGRASGTASPATGLGAPPGLSRTNTASPMVDAGMASRPPGLGGVPALPDDGSKSGRHRSRFGFARSASIERPSSGFGAAPGFANGVSIPVSELFKGVTGVGASSSSSSSSAHQTPVIANGRHSPHPPSSATSSASGNLPFSLPPGVFAPSPSSATVQAAFGTAGLPSASAFPASSSELPLPPPDPSRHAKTSLSDLFPGVDLAASFSSSSALPASLVKSLGISLENLDMQATAAANGKLPNFAPMPLGQGNSIASQPLPPPSAPSATSPSPVPSGGAAMTQSLSTGATSSNGGLGGPMGLGAARQAQQAHAQHAQQAHQQAQLAAQQAAAAQAAQNAAAQSAREQQQAQHQAQAQAQQQLQQHHGRPPSAASGGSAGKTDMYGYMGLANATSPPLPQTPGGFGDAARFQDPAIISFAGMNGYAHPPQHNPYAAMHGYHHHHPEHPSPGAPGGGGGGGVGQGEYYNRYHPLPTPVQPQQTYNPYMPIAPVGLAGMGRLNKAAQTMSQAGAFGLLRR